MDRRTFVAGAALGAATVAGCIAAPGSGNVDQPDDGDPSDDDGSDEPAKTDGSDGTDPKSGEAVYEVMLQDDPLSAHGDYGGLELDLVDGRIGPGSPAVLEATVSGSVDGAVSAFSGAPWPFGVVWLRPVDEEDSSADDVVTLWTDAYADGEDSHHVGTDGRRVTEVEDIGLVRDIEADDAVTRSFELHGDAPGLAAGRYESEIGVTIGPADDDRSETLSVPVDLAVERATAERSEETLVEDPRVDEPPHPIDRPEPPESSTGSSSDDWNVDYLGESIPTTPSLSFEPLQDVRLADPALSTLDDNDGRYAVRPIVDADELSFVVDLERTADAARDRLESIDFADELLVIVESGYGSSSVEHRWRRVEETPGGVHLHGYYTRGYMGTTDYTTRRSAVIVERPETFELARVSLTVREDRRVHFNSTEGPVPVEE